MPDKVEEVSLVFRVVWICHALKLLKGGHVPGELRANRSDDSAYFHGAGHSEFSDLCPPPRLSWI